MFSPSAVVIAGKYSPRPVIGRTDRSRRVRVGEVTKRVARYFVAGARQPTLVAMDCPPEPKDVRWDRLRLRALGVPLFPS
jgi:hypothetical protein